MSSYVSAALRRLVAARADALCEYCLVHEDDAVFGCEVKVLYYRKAPYFRQGLQCRCTCIQMSMSPALSPLAGCQPQVAQSNILCATPQSAGISGNCCQADGRRSSSKATVGKCITLNTPLAKWQG